MQQTPVQVVRQPGPPTNRLRPLLLIGALALSLVSVGAGAWSLALFTSTADVTSNTFTTGTIVISTSPTSALISFSNMFPGDSVTAPLTVSNGGSGQLRYAMTSSSTNTDTKALRDQLTLTVKAKDTDTSGCGNFNGATLYTGAISGAYFGSTNPGADSGDRTLNVNPASGWNEILCFRASLPIGTGNAFQNATTTTTFTFTAEQTANN
jgi:predicted ribosomally synthesized peptide with SipW-like signal peptide